MIEYREVSRSEFEARIPEITAGFAETLYESPYFDRIQIHQESQQARFARGIARPGSGVMFAEWQGEIAGVTTFAVYELATLDKALDLPDIPSVKAVLQQQPEALYTDTVIFWEWTWVLPQFQGEKIGQTLIEHSFVRIAQQYPQGAFLLSWHDRDNTAIVHTAEKLGLQPTGIQQQGDNGKSVEYWFRSIDINYLFDEATVYVR